MSRFRQALAGFSLVGKDSPPKLIKICDTLCG